MASSEPDCQHYALAAGCGIRPPPPPAAAQSNQTKGKKNKGQGLGDGGGDGNHGQMVASFERSRPNPTMLIERVVFAFQVSKRAMM